jgi:nucleoside-diphosphate-sugar epimerase
MLGDMTTAARRVCVTGATGKAGRAAVQELREHGYDVDVRDVAAACRLGLEAEVTGGQNVIIAAADTVMNRPSRDLMAEVFPDVPLTGEVAEYGTLLSVDRAKQVIGYEPRHSWRDELKVN